MVSPCIFFLPYLPKTGSWRSQQLENVKGLRPNLAQQKPALFRPRRRKGVSWHDWGCLDNHLSAPAKHHRENGGSTHIPALEDWAGSLDSTSARPWTSRHSTALLGWFQSRPCRESGLSFERASKEAPLGIAWDHVGPSSYRESPSSVNSGRVRTWASTATGSWGTLPSPCWGGVREAQLKQRSRRKTKNRKMGKLCEKRIIIVPTLCYAVLWLNDVCT